MEFDNADWSLIPSHMQAGLRSWIEEGVVPGGFLCAVLENNLRESIAKADMVNKHSLASYVEFLYNYAPSGCWGSKEKVEDWAARRGLRNIIKNNNPEKVLSHI